MILNCNIQLSHIIVICVDIVVLACIYVNVHMNDYTVNIKAVIVSLYTEFIIYLSKMIHHLELIKSHQSLHNVI